MKTLYKVMLQAWDSRYKTIETKSYGASKTVKNFSRDGWPHKSSMTR